MKTLFLAVLAYLIGSVNPSYLLGKRKGFDIREKGSKNAGGSNAVINFGPWVGIACILFDIAKAFLIVMLAKKMTGDSTSVAIIGTSVILGHIFPFYMRFSGGKGFACLSGFVLAFNPVVFLILLLYSSVVVFLTDYICIAPMTCSILFPVIFGFMTHNVIGSLIIGIASAAILFRHKKNLDRLRDGTELKFSYLWNKDQELERIKKK